MEAKIAPDSRGRWGGGRGRLSRDFRIIGEPDAVPVDVHVGAGVGLGRSDDLEGHYCTVEMLTAWIFSCHGRERFIIYSSLIHC